MRDGGKTARGKALCIRCGRGDDGGQPAGSRCPHCADLHVLVSPDDAADGDPAAWSFEIWRDDPAGRVRIFAVGGFGSSAEALACAHQLVRRYVEQRSSMAP
jgi:hypothetical protein